MDSPRLLDARTTAARLHVSVQTLYAYVSRRKIGRTVDPATGNSLFNPSEVREFARRRARGRKPANVARASLDYGLPVLESRLSTVDDGRLLYRGRDVLDLSETATLEDIARLLWSVAELPAVRGARTAAYAELPGSLDSRLSAWLAEHQRTVAEGAWPQRKSVIDSAARVLQGTIALAVRRPAWSGLAHAALARLWGLDAAASEWIRMALVLHADHELNTSTFAVRCVASTLANPYAAVLAGNSALMGRRHADFGSARALVRSALRARDLDTVIRTHMTPEGALPGFGHPLYPAGDPRASRLLDRMGLARQSGAWARVQRLRQILATQHGLHAKNDFALAAMCEWLKLPEDAGYTIFVVSRMVGWLAHAAEQYESPALIRPRASHAPP